MNATPHEHDHGHAHRHGHAADATGRTFFIAVALARYLFHRVLRAA